nr:MAG: hypothetical protein [Microvirus Sku126]
MFKKNEMIRLNNLKCCDRVSNIPFECRYCKKYQYGYQNSFNDNDLYCSLCGSYNFIEFIDEKGQLCFVLNH